MRASSCRALHGAGAERLVDREHQPGDPLRLVRELPGDADADEEDGVEERQFLALVDAPELVVEIRAAEHLVDGGVAVGRRDHHLGRLLCAVGQLDPGGAVGAAGALGEDPGDAGVVADLASELRVAALQVARHRQRAAEGVAGHARVQPRPGADQRHGGDRRGHQRADGVAQQHGVEAVRELADGELAPAPGGQHPREHARAGAEGVAEAHQLARRQVRRHVDGGEPPRVVEQTLDEIRVGGRQLAQVRLETVEVTPERDPAAVGALVLHPDVQVDDPRVAQQAHLAPQLVHAGLGSRADQPLDAVVDRVALALPGGHQPAWEVVHLVDARPVAVHLGVAAGAQTGDAAADDRQGLARRGWSVDWHEEPPAIDCRGGAPVTGSLRRLCSSRTIQSSRFAPLGPRRAGDRAGAGTGAALPTRRAARPERGAALTARRPSDGAAAGGRARPDSPAGHDLPPYAAGAGALSRPGPSRLALERPSQPGRITLTCSCRS